MILGRKYWLKRLKSNVKARKSFDGWSSVKVIAIIIPAGDGIEGSDLETSIRKWEHQGKHIHVFRVSEERMTKKRESLREHNTHYQNETTWKGIPDSPDFNELIRREYDVVLHLCESEEGTWAYLPYMIETAMYVGPQGIKDAPFDLQMIISNRNWNELLDEIEEWLKKIKNVA